MRCLVLLTAAWLCGSAAAGLKYVAHRGAGDVTMPESSLPAYSNAVATACDIVKLDLQQTKDGVIVLCHDGSLKRYMGWDVKIRDVTYAELLEKGTYRAAGGFDREKIVTLDQTLAIVKGLPEFWFDFKNYSPAMAEKALATFSRHGIAESRLMCATFDYGALADLKKAHPNVRRIAHVGMWLSKDGKFFVSLERKVAYATKREALGAILAAKERLGLFGVNMPVLPRDASRTEPDDIAFLRGKGLWVSLWFVQDRKAAERYRASGADAFVTDHVSKVRF